MDEDFPKNLYEYAIGEMAVEYLGTLRPGKLLSTVVESKALELIDEIKTILDSALWRMRTAFGRSRRS